jgi:antiviral helicase SKI2
MLLASPIPAPSRAAAVAKPLVAPAGKARAAGEHEYEWAVRGGIPHLKAAFERRRPNLAMTHPFELDTFQKEAVLHLEQAIFLSDAQGV